MSTATLVATVGTGLFAGASTYVSLVQHPAWVESGAAHTVKGLRANFRRAAVLQGGLASVSLVAAAVAWLQGAGVGWLVGGVLLGALIPFTLVIIDAVNRQLLDPRLDAGSSEATALLARWGQLHAIRTIVGVAVFASFVRMVLQSAGH